jgi:RNA polymerase sigma-B factor
MCILTKYKEYTSEELFLMYENDNNDNILNAIIEKNLYLAEIISKKFINRGQDYDDLYQVACLGVINAAKRFDVKKGIKFSSFASPTIIGEIKRYFRDKSNLIRVPRRVYEISQKVRFAREELTHINGREPTVEEISKHLGVSEETVLEALEVLNTNSISLEQNIMKDSETPLEEVLGFDDQEFEKIENRDYLTKSLSELTEVEEKFIKERFIYKKTQTEIAKEFGVSQMYISRLEKKILDKLKKNYFRN